jgi:hypothetical protein
MLIREDGLVATSGGGRDGRDFAVLSKANRLLTAYTLVLSVGFLDLLTYTVCFCLNGHLDFGFLLRSFVGNGFEFGSL